MTARGQGRYRDATPGADDRQRGDVPGWVLITLMTAVLVAGLWTFADEALGRILSNALCTVTPAGGC